MNEPLWIGIASIVFGAYGFIKHHDNAIHGDIYDGAGASGALAMLSAVVFGAGILALCIAIWP